MQMHSVQELRNNLATGIYKRKFPPDRTYNMDEIGVTTIQQYKPFVMRTVMMTCQV